MNARFSVSVVVVFVLFIVTGYVVHGVLLEPFYKALPSLYRTPEDMQTHFPYMLPGHLVAALAFVWLYFRMKQDQPPLREGGKFGFMIACLMIFPKFMFYYAVQPIPGAVTIRQIVFDTLSLVVIGIVVAYINRSKTARDHQSR